MVYSPTTNEGYDMKVSLSTFGLMLFEFVDDEVHGVEDVALELVIGVVVEMSASVLCDPLPDQRLHCFFLHTQCLVELLIVTLLVIRAHFLLFDVSLNVLSFELVDDLLAFETLLMLGDLLRLDDMVDELSAGFLTLRMIWLMTGYT